MTDFNVKRELPTQYLKQNEEANAYALEVLKRKEQQKKAKAAKQQQRLAETKRQYEESIKKDKVAETLKNLKSLENAKKQQQQQPRKPSYSNKVRIADKKIPVPGQKLQHDGFSYEKKRVAHHTPPQTSKPFIPEKYKVTP